jgi:hypothetical protein
LLVLSERLSAVGSSSIGWRRWASGGFSVITGSMGASGFEGRPRAAPRNMKKLELNSPEDLVHIGENLDLLNKDTII